MTSPARQGVARFGVFELDLQTFELRRQGRLVRLGLQPARVLATLVSRAGELVTREELAKEIWGTETFVDFDAGLATCLTQIRTALGDRASSPRFIETLPRRGYRCLADVSIAVGEETDHGTRAAVADANGGDVNVEQEPASIIDAPVRSPRRWVAITAAVMLAVATGLAVEFLRSDSTIATGRPPLIAVLPVDTSELPEASARLDVTALAMTEALIGRLATASAGAARIMTRQQAAPLRAAGTLEALETAGAEYFVDVSLRSVAERVRVHAKLAHVTGWILWTRDYELAPDGLSLVQGAIAQTLADSVADEIVPGRRGRSSRAPRRDALPAYAIGHARLEQSRLDDAAAAFDEAARADPGHAGAQTRRAETFIWLALQDRTDRPAVLGRAREIVDRALATDPTFPPALAARGALRLLIETDTARAATDLRASLARDPDQPAARVWLAHVELASGRPESALAEVNVAHGRLPLVPHVLAERMRIALAAGATETTVDSARALLTVAPAWTIARIPLAIALERRGAADQARAELERYLQASGFAAPAGASTAELWSLAARAARQHPFTAALAAVMAGDRLGAAGHLDRARQSRAVDMLWAPAHVILAGLPDLKSNDK